MGSLKDEAFEKLDYLSQLTEIVIAPQNELLAQFPDRVELTLEQIKGIKATNWSGLGFRFETSSALLAIKGEARWIDLQKLTKYFTFEASPDLQIDFANNTMTGKLSLVKLVNQIEDKEVLEFAVNDACSILNSYSWKSKKTNEKLVTVLNTIESGRGTAWWISVQNDKTHRSITRQGYDELVKLFREIILENKWRIRDVKIIVKLGEWVNSYLADATDTSLGLVNLVKLKIMLEKDLPIYSIGEVKNANSV